MDLDDQGIGRVEAQAPTGPKQHQRSPSAGAAAAARVDASAVDSRTPACESGPVCCVGTATDRLETICLLSESH